MQRLSFNEYGTKTIVNKAFGLHFNSDEFFPCRRNIRLVTVNHKYGNKLSQELISFFYGSMLIFSSSMKQNLRERLVIKYFQICTGPGFTCLFHISVVFIINHFWASILLFFQK